MPLTEQLDRLAGFEPAPYPVVSLYLDTRPNQHGRDQHQAFTRKELKARSRTYPANSPERESLDRDIEQIVRFLDNDLNPSANSVAIFACSAGELFETVQSSGVVPQHGLYIGDYFEVFARRGVAYVHYNANYRLVRVLGLGIPVRQQDNYLTKAHL